MMEGKTRLTWKVVKMTHRLWWEASTGPLALRVERDYSWRIDGHEDGDSTEGAPCTDLLAAQLAAEAAALTLLTEAVAAFGVKCWAKIRSDDGGVAVSDHRPKPFLLIDHADATRLACALLAAAARGSK